MFGTTFSRRNLNSFIYVNYNLCKTRRLSISVPSFVNYRDRINGFVNCTICSPYKYHVNYFDNHNRSFKPYFNINRIRFFSTGSNSHEESLEFDLGEKDSQESISNAVKAYGSDKKMEITEIVEDMVDDSDISVEKSTIEDLFQINDYHEYLMTRILDVNGTRRSFLQRFLPVDYVQELFIVVHDYTNLNWSATICLTTLFFKVLLLPVWCASERSRRLNSNMIPKAVELQEKARYAMETKNHQLAMETQRQIFNLTKTNSFMKGVATQSLAAIVQGLMFGTVYGGLRLFAISPKLRPDFSFESCLWLDSLCLPDPYFILPSVFGILITLVFEHNLSLNYASPGLTKGTAFTKLEKRQKYFRLISRCGIIFFTIYGFTMPSSAFFYLIPSFLFQTLLRYASNRFQISRILGIPLPIIKRTKT